MDFMSAVKAMKKEKEMFCEYDCSIWTIIDDDFNRLFEEENPSDKSFKPSKIYPVHTEATWEIYEDEWTLSDKYVTDSRIGEDRLWYEDKDVKEFIKRLKEEIRQSEYVMFSPGIIYEFIDKLAGDELR
jgi:hypothetical protein